MNKKINEIRENLDHLKHLDKEKSKAFIELRKQLEILTDEASNSATGSLSANISSPLLSKANRSGWYNAAKFAADLSQSQNGADLAIPNIYDHLPHLLQFPTGLTPAVRISKKNRRRVLLTIGVPTIKRTKVSYLTTTLRSLIDNLPLENREEVLIVVFIGELGVTEFVTEQTVTLHSEFAEDIESGLLEILVPSANFYPPDLETLEPTFDDSPERMRWRAKQNLDYAYLMMYCQNRGTFYMQLEDDVITKSNYLQTIKGAFIVVVHYIKCAL